MKLGFTFFSPPSLTLPLINNICSRLKDIYCLPIQPGSSCFPHYLSVMASIPTSASLSSLDSTWRVSLRMLYSGGIIGLCPVLFLAVEHCRALWSLFVIGLLFVFKFLLCNKLDDISKLDFSEVMSPVFILLQLVMIRACQLN